MKQVVSLASVVRNVFDSMPEGMTFFGYELKDKVSQKYQYPKNIKPKSVLRTLRRWRHGYYEVIDIEGSLYKKTIDII